MKIKILSTLCGFSICVGAYAEEGRIAISGPQVINAPGSYVLVNDVVGMFVGISIDASDVKLDLNGFTVRQAVDGFSDGITIGAGYRNVEVTNGTITGFARHGIFVPGDSRLGRNLRFSHLRISHNSAYAISVEGNPGFVIEDCLIANNIVGIYANAAGLVLNNVIGGNTRGLWGSSKRVGYRSNVFYDNVTDIDSVATNMGANLCSGGLCP